MRHRLPIAALACALALAACASDGVDSNTGGTDPAVEATDPGVTTTPDGGGDGTDGSNGTATAGLEVADSAPAGADVSIDAVGTTTDRSIQRGGQAAIEQGQTFAVADDITLAGVSFDVVAPDGVPAGQTVELAVYEVGDTVTMAPSGPVDIGGADGRLAVPLPDGIEAGTHTHLVFSLPDIDLGPGQYAVVLSLADGAGPAEMFLQHPNGDVYADGVAISLEGEFWKSNTNDHDSAVTLTFGT